MNNSAVAVPGAFHNGMRTTRLQSPEGGGQPSASAESMPVLHREFDPGLSALIDTARDLAVPYDLETLLNVVSRRARQLMDVSTAYITLPDAEHGTMRVHAATGHGAAAMNGQLLPDLGELATGALVCRMPLWTSDYPADERFAHSAAFEGVVQAHDLRAMMVVPLNNGTEVIGALHIADRLVRQFTAEERSLLISFGDLAGSFIKRAFLFQQNAEQITALGQRAALAEREVVRSRELADSGQLFLKELADGDGFTEIVRRACHALRSPLQVHGTDGCVLCVAGDAPDVQHSDVVSTTAKAQSTRDPVPLDDGSWVVPIEAGGNHLGALLVHPGHAFSDRDWQLVTMAAQSVAVSLSLDNGPSTVIEGDLREELLDDLLTEPRPYLANQLQKRARRLGLDFTQPHVIVTVRTDTEEQAEKLDFWASSHANEAGGLETLHGRNAILLLRGNDAGKAAQAVSAEVSRLFEPAPTVASAGPITEIGDLSPRYKDTLRSLDTMTALGASGCAASTAELGFLGLLLSDNVTAGDFIRELIGPVLDHDRERHTELAKTLEAFFDAGSSQTYAAERLYVHPNTVSRRLEKVTELIGSRWHAPRRAVDIQLALRLTRMRHVLLEPRLPAGTGLAQAQDT